MLRSVARNNKSEALGELYMIYVFAIAIFTEISLACM